jgi:hypothetical protein
VDVQAALAIGMKIEMDRAATGIRNRIIRTSENWYALSDYPASLKIC